MGLFFLVTDDLTALLYASSMSEHLKQTAYSLTTDFTVLRSSTLYREKMNGNVFVCLPQVVVSDKKICAQDSEFSLRLDITRVSNSHITEQCTTVTGIVLSKKIVS